MGDSKRTDKGEAGVGREEEAREEEREEGACREGAFEEDSGATEEEDRIPQSWPGKGGPGTFPPPG